MTTSGGGRWAAALYIFLGIAFGASVPWVLISFASTGELPVTFGFRSLAGGPLEYLSAELFMAAGWFLVAISAIDVVAGVLLWRGRRVGAVIGLVTDPPALALGWGFALPLLVIGVPIRAALAITSLAAGRRTG